MKIIDLAKKINLSVSTVSRVLSNDPTIKVREETKRLIIEEARKNNVKIKDMTYKNILIITAYNKEVEVIDPYYLNLRSLLEMKLKKANFNFEVVEYSSKIKFNKINIFLGSFKSEDIENISKNKKYNIFCDSYVSIDNIDCVAFDYKMSVFNAIDELYEKGHRNIGFIGGNDHNNDIDFREKYYVKYMEEKNIFDSNNMYIESFDSITGYNGVLKLFAKKNIPTALFVANDTIALGCYKALKEMKISVPSDVSIIGFNDSDFAKFLSPSLTSVNINVDNMLDETVKLIEEKVSTNRNYSKKIFLPTMISKRESVEFNKTDI